MDYGVGVVSISGWHMITCMQEIQCSRCTLKLPNPLIFSSLLSGIQYIVQHSYSPLSHRTVGELDRVTESSIGVLSLSIKRGDFKASACLGYLPIKTSSIIDR